MISKFNILTSAYLFTCTKHVWATNKTATFSSLTSGCTYGFCGT